MLLLKRKPGESFSIQPCEDLNLDLSVREVFSQSPIQVVVDQISGDSVKVGIVSHNDLSICWDEQTYRPGRVAMPSPQLGRNARIHQILGQNIRQLRSMKKISGEDLAIRANLSVTLLSALELGIGMVSLDELVRLAIAFEVDVSRLLRNHSFSNQN